MPMPQISPQMMQMLMQMQQQNPQGMQGQQQGMQQMPPQGQPPMPPPQPGAMPPQGAAPQINPNMMAFMQQAQQAQQQGQGQPPMQQQQPGGQPPQGAPQMHPGMPPQQQMQPQPGQQMSPQLQTMLMQRQKMMQQQQMEQQLASQGRNGDKMIAHLTPGEMTVPPEVQTPKVLATLKKAYESKGVHPQQFTAGSPASSVNPATNLPEYNFMSAFLPAALGIAGAALAPETGGASLGLSSAAMGAIGGGIGSTAGGLLAGETPMQAGLGGLGSAVGGYALSGLGSGAGDAAGAASGNGGGITAQQAAILGAKDPGAAYSAAQQMGMNTATPAISQGAMGPPAPGISNLWGNLPPNSINPASTVGSAVGGYIGNKLGTPAKATGPQLPAGFNTPLTQASQLPSFQNQLGYNTYNGPTPNFNGFNPQTNSPGAYNFYGT